MALDLSSLLKRPAGAAVKPANLPIGDYEGIVKKHEYGESREKKTPYVRFHLGLLDWPPGMPDSEKGQTNSETGQFVPTDLAKRNLRIDYYLTEDSLYRLTELLKSCGMDSGRAYDELIPQMQGQRVKVQVTQEVNQQTSEVFNRAGKIWGESA